MCNQGNKVPVDVPVLSHTYAHVRIRANVHLPANASRDSIPPVRHFFFTVCPPVTGSIDNIHI